MLACDLARGSSQGLFDLEQIQTGTDGIQNHPRFCAKSILSRFGCEPPGLDRYQRLRTSALTCGTACDIQKGSPVCRFPPQVLHSCNMAARRLQVALSAALLLTLLSIACPSVLASVPAVGADVAVVSAQEFKALAAVATSGSHGGKRALLQSSGFSQDFLSPSWSEIQVRRLAKHARPTVGEACSDSDCACRLCSFGHRHSKHGRGHDRHRKRRRRRYPAGQPQHLQQFCCSSLHLCSEQRHSHLKYRSSRSSCVCSLHFGLVSLPCFSQGCELAQTLCCH